MHHLGFVGRNWIEPTGMKWMAFPEPAQCEPGPSENTMSFQRLDGVRRTGRMKTTMLAKHRTHRKLVGPNQFDHQESNRVHIEFFTDELTNFSHIPSSARSMTAFSMVPTAGLATITISSPFLSNWRRNDSLIRRRMRLRLTEVPATFLLTTIPILLASWPFSIANTRNSALLHRKLARLKTASNSLR